MLHVRWIASRCLSSAAYSDLLAPSTLPSIRRLLSRALGLHGLDPPGEIVGEARKRLRQRLAGLADRLAVRRQRLRNRPHRDGARNHHHAHLAERAVPGGGGVRARKTAGRIAGDGGGTPEPLLEKMIGEILQSRLHAPIVFAGDEDKALGIADLAGEFFQRGGCGAYRIFLVHPVQNRQSDRLGVDQLDLVAATAQALDHELREPNAHAVGPVRTVEHENAMAHGTSTLSRLGCPPSPSRALMPLEILHLAFVLFRSRARFEGAEIPALAGLRVERSGIKPEPARLQFP